MQQYDEKREIIIKRSRGFAWLLTALALHSLSKFCTAVPADVQKLAKQAIYSLHRGQPVQAQEKIDTAGAMLPFSLSNSRHAQHTSQRSPS